MPLIAEWLALPHVAYWWPDGQIERIRNGLSVTWLESYLVSADGHAFGYLQCYDPNVEPTSEWTGQPSGTRGIDFFIGELGQIGHGHGTGLLRAFCKTLLIRPAVTRIIADPSPDNKASIKALERAGFRAVSRYDKSWGRVLLMARERADQDE